MAANSQSKETNINDILLKIGVPGRYQLFVFAYTFVVGVFVSFQTVAVPFTQSRMDFR